MNEVVWLKDKYLKERWHCSDMKLWRMRKAGKLNSIQIGGCGPWLTGEAEVRRIEAPPDITKARPLCATEGSGPTAEIIKHPTHTESPPIPQAFPNGRAAHG